MLSIVGLEYIPTKPYQYNHFQAIAFFPESTMISSVSSQSDCSMHCLLWHTSKRKKRCTCEKHEYNMNDKKEWDSA